MAQPPIHWTALIAQHRAARVAHGRMRDRDLPQLERDEATIAFGRALDQMFLSMEALSEEGVLAFLSVSLARKQIMAPNQRAM